MRWHRARGAPVDTHVLVHHSRRQPAWLEQCLASLEGEPTNVLLVDSASDHVGALRASAMREGRAPLLSFVDDDDWVMPGAFDACVSALEDDALVGVYTDLADVDPETQRVIGRTRKAPWAPRRQLLRPFEVLHLHVFRRAAALRFLDEISQWPTAEEAMLVGLLVQCGAWRKLDVDGYRKRLHGEGAGARITRDMLRRLTARLSPVLLAAEKRADPQPTIRQRASSWSRAPTGCATCTAVRRAVGKALRI